MGRRTLGLVVTVVTVVATAGGSVRAVGPEAQQSSPSASHQALLDQYCVTCHNDELVNGDGAASSALVSQLRTAGLALDTMDLANVAADTA